MRVGLDRPAGLLVRQAVRRQVRDLAAPADHRLPAGQPAVVDVALEVGVDPVQPLLVKPDLAGVDIDSEVRHGPDPCALHMSLSWEASSGRRRCWLGETEAAGSRFAVALATFGAACVLIAAAAILRPLGQGTSVGAAVVSAALFIAAVVAAGHFGADEQGAVAPRHRGRLRRRRSAVPRLRCGCLG